ncbi:histidine ammonia-lyase [Rhyzopertha dominica]|nr:histidine ammonia-lyase [Rhyzopertha dominica]
MSKNCQILPFYSIAVKVLDRWIRISGTFEENHVIEWLVQEAIKKYYSINHEIEVTLSEVRKYSGGSVIKPSERIRDVLEQDDALVIKFDAEKIDNIRGKANQDESYTVLSITIEDLMNFRNFNAKIKLGKAAEETVLRSRKVIEKALQVGKPVYGVNTGIGNLANVRIPEPELEILQDRLVKSHAAGVGKPISLPRTRMLLALRIHNLSTGYCGISLGTLQKLIDAFNANVLPWVPEQGSVGASGDLAPMSHLALGFMGEGKMWSERTEWSEAQKVLKTHGLEPLQLKALEGVSLVNGTQFIATIGAEAVYRASRVAMQADIVAALSLEALRGSRRSLNPDVHRLRLHRGQIEVAERLRALLGTSSEISESHKDCGKVQDSYTLRCIPQVHGIVHDTIKFVKGIVENEINSVTINPIIVSDCEDILSGGNFHGKYPAKALDYLAIAVHELASMSERRIDKLLNSAYSGHPPFLTKSPGLNSGYMTAHCTAASLVSENKVLCHPSSVDSISTSAGQEDHVSMGAFSARKALQVVKNVESVIAIELLASCQALEFLRPLKTSARLEEVYKVVREVVKPLDCDRYVTPDIENIRELLKKNKILQATELHFSKPCNGI